MVQRQTGLNIVMRLGEAEAGEDECSLARFLQSSDYVVELGSELMSTLHIVDWRLKTATDSRS